MSECINLVCDQYTKPPTKDIVHEMSGEAVDIAIKVIFLSDKSILIFHKIAIFHYAE